MIALMIYMHLNRRRVNMRMQTCERNWTYRYEPVPIHNCMYAPMCVCYVL